MSQPTTRRLLEPILATEEEHADDLADLLQVMQPNAEARQQPLRLITD